MLAGEFYRNTKGELRLKCNKGSVKAIEFTCEQCGGIGRSGIWSPRRKLPRFCSVKCLIAYQRSPEARPDLNPNERPSMLDISWAAALFEGEGHCTRTGNGKQTESVTVGQKDRWILDRLRTLFGGSISPTKNRGKQFFTWVCTGQRARGFLMTIYGFLSPRRKAQVRKALLVPA